MESCPHCSYPFELEAQADGLLKCPSCGQMVTTGGEDEEAPSPSTTEVSLADAKVLVTACPRCRVGLTVPEGDLGDAKFGKCEPCGFVFVLAEGSLEAVPITDPRVMEAKRMVPFRSQPPQKAAEEITGESTNVDSGIKDRAGRTTATLYSEAPPMRVVISQDAVVIGRVKADITIDSPDVSRRHAVVERKGGVFVVRDLGSTNGTYVNGQRVEEAPLANGDRLVVGQTVFFFQTAAEGEGIYLLLAMAPAGASAQSPERQKRCLEAWGAALGRCFGVRERDVLSSAVTGRALAIFPFEDSVPEVERMQLAKAVLTFPKVLEDQLARLAPEGGQDEARVAIALGPAKRVVQDGKSKLTGDIIQRIAGLFAAGAPPPSGGIVEEASLHRLLTPTPDDPVDEMLARLGFSVRAEGDPALHALIFFPSGGDGVMAEVEELCIKSRVGIEAELATAFGAGASGVRNPKLAARLAKAAGDTDVRVRSSLYKALLPSPIFVTRALLLSWLKHLDEGGKMLEKFQPVRSLYAPDELAVVSAALRLLGAAFHGLPDLTDLDLPSMTLAATRYLQATSPQSASDARHPLGRVLEIYQRAGEVPSEASAPLHLFEFLALLALIRALRTRGGATDIAHAKTLLESLKTYGTIWAQMLREEPKEARA